MAGIFQTTQKTPATQIQKSQRKPSWINTNRSTDTHVDTYCILSNLKSKLIKQILKEDRKKLYHRENQ